MENNKEMKLKNIVKEQIGIVSFMVASAVFLIRGMWYFYYCGYFKAFNIDKSLLTINNDTSLYSVLGLIGIAVFLCVLNYLVYYLVLYKRWIFLSLTLLVEVLALFLAICVMFDIGSEQVLECLRNPNWQGLGYICVNVFVCVILINMYAIVFFIAFHLANKKTSKSTETISDKVIKICSAENEKQIEFALNFAGFIVLVSVVLGVVVFFTGMRDAKEKIDFRVIEETYLEENHEVEDKYLFKKNGQPPKQYYAVLYELEDKYVVASLALEDGNVVKDLNKQKVISKENIVTYYYANLENDFWNKEEKQNIEMDAKTDRSNQKGKENGSMIEVFLGAFIGALATGVVTFLIERHNRKKEGRIQESHAASILFYDLKSIEDYMAHERSSVNLRYTVDWQDLVASCSFLKDQHIEYIYQIYDVVYNYNYYYKLKEQTGVSVSKETIPHYEKIQEIIFDKSEGDINKEKRNSKYEEIRAELKKHIL